MCTTNTTRARRNTNITNARLSRLAWQHVRLHDLDCAAEDAYLADVADGTTVPDAHAIAAGIEALIRRLHLHDECKDRVRDTGRALYDYRGRSPRLADNICEECARPLACIGGAAHAYVDLSPAECRARGIYHGGRCYTVSLCLGCGHVEAVDSSD